MLGGGLLPYRRGHLRVSIVSFLVMAHRHGVAVAASDQQTESLFPGWVWPVLLGVPLVFLMWRLAVLRGQIGEERAARADLERSLVGRVAQLEANIKELDGIGYSVSHDLRAPLRAIDGFSRMLEEDYGEHLDEEGRRRLQVVRNNSQKMGRMIEHVLAYSRVGRAQLSITSIDMRRLAEDALKEIGAAGGERSVVVGELPRARGDVALVRQALVQVLGNAIKFSAGREPALVEVSGSEDGGESVYRVKDNGVGFDMRHYEKVFQLFQRLHPEDQFPGEGVGLSIAQRIVVRHGGRLWAESSPGAGATFYLALPLRSGQEETNDHVRAGVPSRTPPDADRGGSDHVRK